MHSTLTKERILPAKLADGRDNDALPPVEAVHLKVGLHLWCPGQHSGVTHSTNYYMISAQHQMYYIDIDVYIHVHAQTAHDTLQAHFG